MRPSLPLLITIAWAATPLAGAQTPSIHPAKTQRHTPSQRPAGTAQRSTASGKPDGVLALGATDITGNKELPKVMVIVPWKDSLGASGVVKPTDSLLDQVLQPVDRGVFQREIHYYGQLEAGNLPARGKVAPVGDRVSQSRVHPR